MISVTDFRTRYPEFSDVVLYTDLRIQMFIDEAVIWMAEKDKWLDWYLLAQFPLVAHLLVSASASESGDSNALFPVNFQEVDDVIIKTAVGNANPTSDNFHSTIYGQAYYRYLRMTFTGVYGV